MKKLLSIVTALALCLSMLPVTALAAGSGEPATFPATEGNEGNIYFDTATGTITRCDKTVTEVNIPSSINGVDVTGISGLAFNYCSSLTSVTIPDSVTSIGVSAFSGCSSLTDISVDSENPKFVSKDGVLFDKQKSILICYPAGKSDISYDIPDSVTSIADLAFYGCSRLTGISIPDSVTSIGGGAFEGCSGLTGISIPDSVTSIENSAFKNCSGLTSVTIPDGVTCIEKLAFGGCSGLTSVTIPDSVTSIEVGAFSGCSGLTGISIPGGVTSIGWSAFEGCSGLTSVTIPDGVTSIENSAFFGCSGLTSVKIPDGVTCIENSAFEDCSGLISITIPDGVKSIGWSAFSGCSSLADVYYAGSESQWKGIEFGSKNDPLIPASIHYNSAGPKTYTLIVNGGTGSGVYEVRKDVTITAIVPDGQQFTGWTVEEGNLTLINPNKEEITFAMPPSDVTVTATCKTRTYAVKVINGTGGGDYEVDEDVTITAIVPPGQQFTGWIVEKGDLTLTDPNKEEITFPMPPSDVTVRATYKTRTYTVTINDGTGDGEYAAGARVTIKANAAPAGKVFGKWITDDGVIFADAASETTTFTMPASDVTVTASYKTRTYAVKVNYGTGSGDYEVGDDVTITAIVPDGKQFTGWIVEKGNLTLTNPNKEEITFAMPASDVIVTATFEDAATPPTPAQTYTVTVIGGTGGGKFSAGARVTIKANEAPKGKAFDKWTTGSGVIFADAASATTTFTMPANDVTVTATYKDATTTPEQTYTLIVTGGSGGGKYAAGAKVTIKANPAPEGKAFGKWTTSGGGTFADAASATTIFTMPASDVTVTATYKDAATPEQTYTLTVTGGTGGGKYAAGAKAAITADAAPAGKVFDKWTTSSGGTFADAASETTTFTMPANDVTVTATYKDAATPEQTAYVISFDPNGGTVDIPSMATGPDGKLSGLPIPVYSGYIFNGWYTAPAGGSLVSRDTVFDGNTTVYAHWVPEHNNSDSSSSSFTEYAIIAPSTTGGTVTVNREYAAKGTSVSITVTPDSGYEMTSLIARDSWWNELKLTDRGGGKFTLTMPDRAVTVNATFTVTPAAQPSSEPVVRPSRVWPYPGFTDVPINAWYYDAVSFVCETGLMKGLGSAVFSPYDNLSRAQLTQILYNMAGCPAAGGISGFSDVTSGDWYANAVAWAVSRNIIGGYDGGTFGPYDYVTREEIVVMLWRYAGEPASEEELCFSDTADISIYAQTAVRWAVEKGILNGNNDGALTPKGLATRAQVAQMLKNYFNS